MATQVKIKRRTMDATPPAGLTVGEIAINLVDKKLYVGGNGGTNVIFLDSSAVVTSFNGITGAVTGITAGGANTFTALNSFNAGISAAGGVTLAGTLQGTTANFTGLVSSAGGFSGAGTNLTNVAKLNTSNTFSAGSTLTLNGVAVQTQFTNNSIIFTEGYDDGTTKDNN